MSSLIKHIRESVIGAGHFITTPFGRKPLIYADYTASGRSLTFIEDFIREQVLPYYANTHTETSYTGAQTTALREQARELIRASVNGTAEDQVIFCGPGATAAINKLLDILNLRLPRDLSEQFKLESLIPDEQRPVVFIGPYEHHSNELPWRESIAEVVVIPLTPCGQIDLAVLEEQLCAHSDRPVLIGSFSAASNVTGVRTDIEAVTSALKRHGALAFWDYAAAAPYVGIDMNGASPLDAVFISPHKFVGGPGTPGLLVVKKSVMNNSVPAVVGGGTVVYVTPEDHRFIDDPEHREEGGTPAIIESIRAGLVFKLQQEVGTDLIERLEGDFVSRALERFKACPALEIMGNPETHRLSIMSLRFKHGDKDLHYGFVVSLLNDLFGIQVRGGCSCAGPYGHTLLGMDMEYSRAIESEIAQGELVLRPGWVRLNFNYFIAEQEFEYLLRAVELVAQHGWRMLPLYHFDADAGVWRYRKQLTEMVSSLNNWRFAELCGQPLEGAHRHRETEKPAVGDLEHYCLQAEEEMCALNQGLASSVLELRQEAERLRWFVLPQEVAGELAAVSAVSDKLILAG